MRCKKCKTKAVIGLPRHNAAFCKPCFNEFVHDQVARAIKSEGMFAPQDRNLVDEAARLLGNVLHWQEEYLDKQAPTLPASLEGFTKKVKPLYRLAERELAAYAVLNRIEYIVEECPMAKGSKMLLYKEVLNRLESESPGTKQDFY